MIEMYDDHYSGHDERVLIDNDRIYIIDMKIESLMKSVVSIGIGTAVAIGLSVYGFFWVDRKADELGEGLDEESDSTSHFSQQPE